MSEDKIQPDQKKAVDKTVESFPEQRTVCTSSSEIAVNRLYFGDKDKKPKKISHIGIAVQSIDDTISFYTDVLGLELEAVETVASEGVKIAFLSIGETRFELLEPLHDTSIIQKFIDKKGEGVHHIALAVDNIKERLVQYKNGGINLINEEAKRGADNSRIAFLHPKQANGVLFELCQEEGGSEG
ncbi:methylmalonyl-CoA epimerase [Virgibacillus dakarensis]|uniref:VOC domain-containing protein n=1 Tax=Lentibacillus populi TaxID=1827502 RepID=A0A9W5TVS0_9BACI|nr:MULTISPECIES: methylmalonyl-CoA epimerase [Bacillaceae]MTW85069.1 methylmalonyl-CoA epimerase [Virgibacillus dakarensis]GGB34478.1 hypothetical protein GCM10011409_09950 [Lentibacillus populi]